MNSFTQFTGAAPSQLRLFLDSADVLAWQKWLTSGLFYGVTTNPLLLQRAGVPCALDKLQVLVKQAFALGIKEMQLQTWGVSKAQMISTGQQLAAIDPRVVVKVPCTQQGTEVAVALIAQGIRVTLTAVYAVHQVLSAAALGADYAAPYLGRLNDMGRDGRQDLIAMQQALQGVQSPVRVLAASIRDIEDITLLCGHGLDTFTFSTMIAEQWFDVPGSAQAAADFETAAYS